MSQPAFTFWPWKVLSLAVPAMAITAAVLAVKNHSKDEECFAIFFSVVAAGNAYLFSMAIGDFGRSVVAIPIGAVAGFLAVAIFSHGAPSAVFLFMLMGITLFGMISRITNVTPGCLLLGILLLMVMAASRSSHRSEPALSAFAGFPFVCAAVAGCMPLRRDLVGVIQAAITGARAAMFGMLFGAVSFFILMILFGWSSKSAPYADYLLFAAGLLMTMTTNYFCVRFIFTAVHRVQAPAPLAPDSGGVEDKLEPQKAEKIEAENAQGSAASSADSAAL